MIQKTVIVSAIVVCGSILLFKVSYIEEDLREKRYFKDESGSPKTSSVGLQTEPISEKLFSRVKAREES